MTYNYMKWMCKLSTPNIVSIKKYYAKNETSVQSREMTNPPRMQACYQVK